MSYKIKDLEKDLRPRERLIKYGISSLGDDEVIALLLRCGTKECNVKELSNLIIKEIDGLKNFSNISLNNLSKIKGIGVAKATTLLAALEFGKRVLSSNNKKIKLNNSHLVYEMFKYDFFGVNQEKLLAVYLDNNKQLIASKIIFIGTVNQSIAHPREIFKEAVANSASSIVLLHNHPSGNINPSLKDEVFTDKMIKLGKEMDIPLIDHLIIGDKKYYSIVYKREYIDEFI